MSEARFTIALLVAVFVWLLFRELRRKKVVVIKENELDEVVLESEVLDLEGKIAAVNAMNSEKKENVEHKRNPVQPEEGEKNAR